MNFRDMSREQRIEMARRGGRVAQARGTGRRWTTEDARAAALKGVAMRKHLERMQASIAEVERVNALTADLPPTLRCPTTLDAFDGPEEIRVAKFEIYQDGMYAVIPDPEAA